MKNTFDISNGTYGPSHDPYAFTDILFTNNSGDQIKLHLGINTKVTLPDGTVIEDYDCLNKEKILTPEKIFAAFIGLDLKIVKRLIEREERNRNEFPDPFGSPGDYI